MKLRHLWIASALLCATTLAAAPRMPDGPHRPPPPHEIIRAHADELGIDPATVKAIIQLAEAARPELQQRHKALDAARERLDELMDAPGSDRSAILEQVQAVGEAHNALKSREMEVMLGIRDLLTPDQWSAFRELMPPPGPPAGPPPGRDDGHRRPPPPEGRGGMPDGDL
jgi:Spy/CpxP family protein refolding chaperone